jgi:uncharacterized protein (DUF2147 family)
MRRSLPILSMIGMILLLIGSAFTILSDKDAEAIVGTWKTGSGNGWIRIYKEGSSFSGKITWLAEAKDPRTGDLKLDLKNKDSKFRDRTIMGIINVREFKYLKPGLWEKGRIYNPEDGADYKCTITMIDPNTIEVHGFEGISVHRKTEIWKRVK